MTEISAALARKIASTIAEEIGAQTAQVESAVGLLDEGATVPFIARYRKEVTNGLDDVQLRELEARLSYLRELEDRRLAVLKAIDEQGKLHIGMDAIRLMYRRLGKPKTAWFTSLPVLRGFFDWLYPIFARHRYKMPVWLLGIGVKDVCQDGYCQMPAQQKAAQIRKKDHESH